MLILFCSINIQFFAKKKSPFSNVPMQNGRTSPIPSLPHRSQWPDSPEVRVHWDDQHMVRLRFAFQRSLAFGETDGKEKSRCTWLQVYIWNPSKHKEILQVLTGSLLMDFFVRNITRSSPDNNYAFRNSLIFDDHWAHTDWRLRSCFTGKKRGKLQLNCSSWVTHFRARLEFDEAFAISRSASNS